MPEYLQRRRHHGGQLQSKGSSSVFPLSTHRLYIGRNNTHRMVKDKNIICNQLVPHATCENHSLVCVSFIQRIPKGLSGGRKAHKCNGATHTARKVHVRCTIESELSSIDCCLECLVPSWWHHFERLCEEH